MIDGTICGLYGVRALDEACNPGSYHCNLLEPLRPNSTFLRDRAKSCTATAFDQLRSP